MNPESNPDELNPSSEKTTDNLADRLAKFDDSLTGNDVPLAAEDEGNLSELEETILRLERHWPRTAGPSKPKSVSTDGIPANEGQQRKVKIGRFEIQHELGRGGFGVVFLARDPRLNRLVAIKVPRPEALLDEDRRQRFASEAEAAAALNHPVIVPVFEANPNSSTPYIVSAYCEGPNLRQWLAKHQRVENWEDAVALVATLAEGVEHAHTLGICHRDIKPSNILLVSRNVGSTGDNKPGLNDALSNFKPRLTDFGLAKLSESCLQDTRSSLMIGTPLYMAPEQLEGHIDPKYVTAVDIYALGCLLFELLTGEPPIDGATYIEVADRLRNSKPQRLRKLRPECPAELEAICDKCLEKSPQLRYESSELLSSHLRSCLAGEPLQKMETQPLVRFIYWCKRSNRIREAGLFALSMNLVLMLWMVVVGSQMPRFDLLEPGQFPRVFGEILMVILLCHVPQAIVGWQCLREREWAVGGGLVLSIVFLILPSFLGDSFFQQIYKGSEFFLYNSRMMVTMFFIVQVLLYTVAYVALITKRARSEAAN